MIIDFTYQIGNINYNVQNWCTSQNSYCRKFKVYLGYIRIEFVRKKLNNLELGMEDWRTRPKTKPLRTAYPTILKDCSENKTPMEWKRKLSSRPLHLWHFWPENLLPLYLSILTPVPLTFTVQWIFVKDLFLMSPVIYTITG